MRIRTILVPVDFSPHSDAALETAIGFARSLDARVELLHCYEVGLHWSTAYDVLFPEELWKPIRIVAKRKLIACADRVREAGLDVGTHLTTKPPRQAIPDEAARIDADLIVMATRGVGGVKHLLLGGVAMHIVRAAPCPVMTVTTPRD